MRESLRARKHVEWDACEGSQVKKWGKCKVVLEGRKQRGRVSEIVSFLSMTLVSKRALAAVCRPFGVFVTSNVQLRGTNIQTFEKIHFIRQNMFILKVFTFENLQNSGDSAK